MLIPFFFRTAVSYAAAGHWRAVAGGGAVPGAVWCQERGYCCGAGFRALFASTLSPPVYARRLPKTRLQSHVSGRNAVREMSPQRRLRLFTAAEKLSKHLSSEAAAAGGWKGGAQDALSEKRCPNHQPAGMWAGRSLLDPGSHRRVVFDTGREDVRDVLPLTDWRMEFGALHGRSICSSVTFTNPASGLMFLFL